MKFRIANRQDFAAGAFFLLIGIGAVAVSLSYPLGSAARMGPGYFPLVLGGILAVLGTVIAIQGVGAGRRTSEVSFPRLSFRPLFIVLGSVALFAFLLNKLGFVLSTLLLIVLSSLAYRERHWRAIVISAAVLTALSTAIFGYGLKLQFPLWPGMLGWS